MEVAESRTMNDANKHDIHLSSETRKMWKQARSRAITLPVAFVQAHFIQEGDDLAIVANHIVKVMPMPEVIA